MSHRTSRRDFLKHSTAIGVAFWVGGEGAFAAPRSPNEKLSIGIIGPGGKGASNIAGVATENIVAICEVDDLRGAKELEQYPQATRYYDFRRMLDKEEKNLDAVIVSTPDHIHVPASVMAMRMGLHCYCEKPLSHSVYESRLAAEVAAKYKVATQLGTQVHAGENYRRVVEVIQSGAIGPVREAHVWVHKVWGGGDRPADRPPVPETLKWDLWLGPAPERPYHSTYLPGNWRRWWDFGSGTLGDMACHYMDLPYWALKLRHPLTCEARGARPHAETAPVGLQVDYEFPARDDMPPCKLTWYDGDYVPETLHGVKVRGTGDGVLFVGDKGMMQASYGSYKLLPEGEFEGFKPPEPTIPRSIGHHQEWVRACKTGEPTTCNFDYSGALSEAVLLGTVAYRVGKKLEWDAAVLKAANCPEADNYIQREYRKGWTLAEG